MSRYREFYRRHLPHWQPLGAILFVTFRLKDSLSGNVVESLLEKGEQDIRRLKHLPENNRAQIDFLEESRSFSQWDSHLDRSDYGPRWLAQHAVAEIVQEALHYRDGREYDLFAFCIMPNHVHAVIAPLEVSDSSFLPLSRIMQSLKRHTARKANLLLGREGTFWQDESYDHLIRNEGEFEQILCYVLENPVKAGLVSEWEAWPWTYCRSD